MWRDYCGSGFAMYLLRGVAPWSWFWMPNQWIRSNQCKTYNFDARYKPIGKITKPTDKKTSLSEGGSCHMGRAAQLPRNAATLNTRNCRKIYSNHTHVVARLVGNENATLQLCIKTLTSLHSWAGVFLLLAEARITILSWRERCQQLLIGW